MDEAKLAEIEARANAATPGPWCASTGRTYDTTTGKVAHVEHYVARGDDDVGIASDVCDSRTGEQSEPNARFIAHARTDVPALVAEVRRLTAALATARREGAEEMREAVKAEIHAAFHYNDPPDDGVERPIGPIQGQREAHQTLRRLLSRVCAVLTEGGAT